MPETMDNGIKIDGRTIFVDNGSPVDVIVYDLKGQIVFSAKSDDTFTEVSLDTLDKGIYIVNVNSFTFKIHLYE